MSGVGARALNFRNKLLVGALSALTLAAAHPGAAADAQDLARWRTEAAAVTIVRDDWGIAHIHGHTDADAVFGMIYAEAEDDFSRVETNYLNSLGRLAEAEGEKAIWTDLRQRLFVDDEDLKARYRASPPWLQKLMDAWADGLNYYLATHKDVTPRAIRHFEPWMALSFSEGSIGGDIERVSPEDLAAFYGKTRLPQVAEADEPLVPEPKGSNGIAIAPSDSADGHALLLINPHTSFYFRSEQQVSSDEGLDAYGAATWGQFFIYQGFNPHAGWMHTSSNVDVVDEFAETVTRKGDHYVYRYGNEERPVTERTIRIAYKAADGSLQHRDFTAYFTHHGPIVREADGKWISIALMNKPVEALEQSFLRTKAVDYASFMKIAELKANSSNNTIFADDKGEIAYLHPQFIPRRDNRFDYTKPVDGSDPATDWKGLHALDQAPRVYNPSTGWLFNTNDWPYTAAGPDSPKRADFPKYMDTKGENPRGLHAMKLLESRRNFTLDGLINAAFDPWLPSFARLVPGLVKAYDQLPAADPRKARLAGPIAVLRTWDDRWGYDSVATSVAVFWGEDLYRTLKTEGPSDPAEVYDFNPVYEIMGERAPDATKLEALDTAVTRLEKGFGTWKTPWGEINRFQRLDDSISARFDDTKPSIPVPFTSALWGSLASFGAHAYPNTHKYYGTLGNSFVAAVEFGPRVRARAVTAGGESGDPSSPHFRDEAQRYATGNLREVYFYPDQLKGHVERTYHPGG
jgi:acyl-homoserine-lactone acylase